MLDIIMLIAIGLFFLSIVIRLFDKEGKTFILFIYIFICGFHSICNAQNEIIIFEGGGGYKYIVNKDISECRLSLVKIDSITYHGTIAFGRFYRNNLISVEEDIIATKDSEKQNTYKLTPLETNSRFRGTLKYDLGIVRSFSIRIPTFFGKEMEYNGTKIITK